MIKEIATGLKKSFSLWQRGNDIINRFSDYWKINRGDSQSGWISSCLNTMGNYFSQANFRVYEYKNNDKYEIPNHPFIKLFNRPNDFQVGWELKYFMAVYFALKGNYYLLKLPNSFGLTSELVMLDPMRITPVGSKYKQLVRYDYDLDGEIIPLETERLIHLRFPNPNSLIKGDPLISGISDTIDIDKLQTAYMKKFYENGGFMGQMFTTNAALSETQFDRALKQLNKRYGSGVANAYKVALFEQGLQPVKSAYSIKEMELNAQRKLTMEETTSAFRIPQILLGGSSDTYNRATAEAAIYGYMSSFVDPTLNYVDEVLTIEVKKMYKNDNLIVKHDKLAPKDIETSVKVNKEKVQIGALTINEMRVEDDYEPFKHELANVPLAYVGGAIVRLDNGEQLGSIPNNVPKSKAEPLYWRQYNSRFEKQSEITARAYTKFFEKQKDRLIEKLGQKDLFGVEAFFTLDEFLALRSLIELQLKRIVFEGYRFGFNRYGGDGYDELSSIIVNSVSEHLKKSESINETTKKQLLNMLNNQMTTSEVVDLIKKNFVSQDRIKVISETTVNFGLNLGIYYALRQAGFKKKMWVSQRDSEVRDAHHLADGLIVNIDESFLVKGEYLMFPGDPVGSAENIINCRCVIEGVK